VAEIAALAGVGTATVDRILNDRKPFSEHTRERVISALEALRLPRQNKRPAITFLCESGDSFNRALTEAVQAVAWRRQDLSLKTTCFSSADLRITEFVDILRAEAERCDGLVLIAREDTNVVRAARAIKRSGKAIICLATDLPRSARCGYVGSDERGAGAAAAQLIGNLVRSESANILFVSCGNYQAGRDREAGFNAVLERDFPKLKIKRRIDVKNDAAVAHQEVVEHIRKNGKPDVIYSIAGGNSGIGRALEELNIANEVVFVGHELNSNSRKLLMTGTMDYLIGRDQEREVMLSLAMLEAVLDSRPHHDRDMTQVRIISRYTCA